MSSDRDQSESRDTGSNDETGWRVEIGDEKVHEAVQTVDSLPSQPLEQHEYTILESSAQVGDSIFPILDNRADQTVNGVGFITDKKLLLAVWEPDGNRWVQVVCVNKDESLPGADENSWVVEAASVYDDDTGEPIIEFAPNETASLSDLYDYTFKYIEHVYDETDHLWFIPHSVTDMADFPDPEPSHSH